MIISPLKQFAKQNLDIFIEYGFKQEISLIVTIEAVAAVDRRTKSVRPIASIVLVSYS